MRTSSTEVRLLGEGIIGRQMRVRRKSPTAWRNDISLVKAINSLRVTTFVAHCSIKFKIYLIFFFFESFGESVTVTSYHCQIFDYRKMIPTKANIGVGT